MTDNKAFLQQPIGNFLADWSDLATGESGDIELERAWLSHAQAAYLDRMPDVIKDLFAIFCKKQHDYGPNNIALGGPKGVTLRMVDKFSRLWNLQGFGKAEEAAPSINDESLMDTWMDLADYGIIGAMSQNGDWPRLSIDEAFKDFVPPLKHDTDQPMLPFESEPE